MLFGSVVSSSLLFSSVSFFFTLHFSFSSISNSIFYPVLFCLILSYPVLFCLVLSYPILSYPILSYSVLSYPVLFCLVLSYPILSYSVLSYRILSCPICLVLSYFIQFLSIFYHLLFSFVFSLSFYTLMH